VPVAAIPEPAAAPEPAESAIRPYTPGEIEAIARLLLRDEPVRALPGSWWRYVPAARTITYPPLFLQTWPGDRVIGALIHEVAEVLFSGAEGLGVFAEVVRSAASYNVSEASVALLLNAINDLRVNRLYLRAHPGASRYLRAVYVGGAQLERPDDFPEERRPAGGLPHHQYLDAVTARWTRATWPEYQPPTWADAVADAVRRTGAAVDRVVASDTLSEAVAIIQRDVLPVYSVLVAASRKVVAEADTAPVRSEDEPPERAESEDLADADESDHPPSVTGAHGGAPAGSADVRDMAVVEGESQKRDTEQMWRQKPSGQPAQPARPDGADQSGMPVRRGWTSAGIYRVRSRAPKGPDYERYDYVAAVRRLEPQIRATLDGRPGQLGLTEILNLRRFGTSDPWRRPRRRQHGDSGEIDPDRPENLVVDPSVAFLHGSLRRRDDSQKDFANTVMLDISGSVVQKGYASRKFDILVDSLVVFCELHERLKLPYELLDFSDDPTTLRAFSDAVYAQQHVDPASAYVIKDFSYLVRAMYDHQHGETQEARALRQALGNISRQRGLKTILMITDGVSSDRPALTRLLWEVEERNSALPVGEQIRVLAFGVGLAEEEFRASYEPDVEGQPIRCSAGFLVPKVDALPTIICRAVEDRIRTA
jgi:hypothetical protein